MKYYGQSLSCCYLCGSDSGLVVCGGALMVCGGSAYGDWRVLALVIDFRDVMLTSPLELGH